MDNTNMSELVGFLEKIERKGEIPSATAQARKIACQAVIDVVANDEPHTVEWMRANLDSLMNRLINKNDRLSTASANVYKSRIQSALNDFAAYQIDPLGWRPKLRRVRKGSENKIAAARNNLAGTSQAEPQSSDEPNLAGATPPPIYNYPLRPGVRVELRNLPDDLTIEEVWRLACFAATLAKDFRPTNGNPFEVVARGRSE
jgi:hypothetical protein